MRRVNTLLFLAALSVAALGQTAQAIVWNGSFDTDFTNGANWDGGVAPADDTVTDSAIWNGAPTANQPTLNVNRSVGAVYFDYPTSTGFSGWDVTGSGTLSLQGYGSSQVITNGATSGTNTISLAGISLMGPNYTTIVVSSGGRLVVSSLISGTGGFNQNSAGTLVLSNVGSTYTGINLLQRGTWVVSKLSDLGVASSLGAESDPDVGVIYMGGSSGSSPNLRYTGSGDSTNRRLYLSGSASPTYSIYSEGTGALTFTGDIVVSTTSATVRTFALRGTNTGDNTFSGIISDTSDGSSLPMFGVTKSDAGKWILSGANTYHGQTKASGGTLQFNTILNVGAGASALGAPATVANGTIDVGASSTTGTLRYTGGVQSTDRVVNLAGATGGATIDASGSGALTFTSAFTATGAGAKTLTLRGTNTDDNTIGGAIVDNSGVNTTSLTKIDAGKWVLSGASTYSGKTAVSGGTLQYNTIANVGGGASALGAPTTVADGTIDLGLSAGTTFTYTGPTTSTDRVLNLAGTGSVFLSASGSGPITFTSNPTATGGSTTRRFALRGTNTGDNTISGVIADGAGPVRIDKLNPGKWVLTGANTFSGSTATAPSVAVGEGTLEFNSIANVGAGASALGAPTTAAAGTILLGSFTVNGAGILAADLRYTGSGHSTDRVVDLSGSTGPVAIYANGSGPLTFTSAFTASQTTAPGAKTLTLRGTNTGLNTIGGAIVDGAGVTSLNKDDDGKWILGGANTYTGGTTVTAGRLAVSDASAKLGTGNVTVLGTTVGSVLEIQSGVSNAIADTATLSLLGGGTAGVADQGYADLGSGINETIASLLLNGVAQAAGTYGSTFSGATFQNNEFFAGTGRITVPAAGIDGDYNNNNVVDAADYVLWRMGGTLDHDPTPGNQDPGDYDFWRSRFGNVPASTASATGSVIGAEAAVPEPATCVLACLGAAALLLTRRRAVSTV